jgi:hypothetical protein
MTKSRFVLAALVSVAALVLASCAAGPNDVAQTSTEAAGFWLGLWQGLISPITFLISLFNDQVSIYEVHNNGNWYDFGFMLGVSTVFSGVLGGGAATSSRARSARSNRNA